ncbi:MAG TPA: two-component regulator propeller domain-containing protein, partial [Anaerolineales bacterium]
MRSKFHLNSPMAKQQKLVVRLGCFLAFGIVVTLYFLAVKLEEDAYEKSKGEWIIYTSKNSPLKYDPMPISILTTDDQGRLWIGTEWESYVIDSNGTWSILSNNIQAITTDRSGRVWIASDGLYITDASRQWTTFPTSRDWEGINALAIDSQDRIWVGTFDGLLMFDRNGKETIYTQQNSGLVHNTVTALAVDRFDRVWIGTFGHGISVLDPDGRWTTYQGGPRRSDNNILTFFVDPQDRIWIGTVHGLRIMSADGTQTSNTGSQWGILPSSIITVNSFVVDREDRMWIAIAGRLVVVDSKNNSFTTYSWDNSGLPGVVNALAIDTNDRLWIGTVKGLSVIDLQSPIPETVPADWLARRRALRMPGEFVSIVGGLLFLPVAFEVLRWWYILLLVLTIPVGIGIQKGSREKNRLLLYGSSAML